MESSILSAIGDTPVIELKKVFKENDFQLYLKMEALNPGGSAKDRSGYSMLMQAIEAGEVNKNTVVIESSSGNLGIALAQLCRYFNLRFICVVDVKTTEQNIKLLKAYGTEIDYVDKPDPVTGEYLQARLTRVKELLEKIPNSYRPNQYANVYNPLGHQNAMREIDEYFKGDIDYVFCATSTCGTVRGYSEYISEHNLSTKLVAVDAVGSIIFGGERKKRLISGHGAAVVPGLYYEGMVDECVHVTDLDCIKGCRTLVNREAVLAGGSTGAILSAIRKIKHTIPSGSKCIMIMHDRGERYLDTIYSDEWVKEHFGEESLMFNWDEVLMTASRE